MPCRRADFYPIQKKFIAGVSIYIVLVFLFSVAAARAQGTQPIFPTANTIQVGSIYSGETVTDLNLDGKPDLVYFNSPTQLTVVLDVLGTAATEPVVSLSCSTNSQHPAIADINGDGRPDIVFSCTNFFVVLIGNGDGTFASPVYYAANQPSDPVLADLNGDKYLDVALITTGSSGSQLSVFLNEGAAGPGTFASAVNYLPGNAAPSLSAPLGTGDFNGDGRIDLVAFSGTGYVLFAGNGDGTLQTPLVSSTQGTSDFITGDFNGDGITDIAYVHSANTSTSFSYPQILLGAVSGIFSQGAALSITGGQNDPVYLATAPLPNTGPLGLVVSGAATTIYRNDGKGNFTQTGTYAPAGIPFVCELSGCGKSELLLIDQSHHSVFPLTGNGDGTFNTIPGTAIAAIPGPANGGSALAAADFNGDGVEDAAFLTTGSGTLNSISTVLGRGDGSFGLVDQTTATSGNFLIAGDFNGDKKPDVIAIQQGVGLGHGATTQVDAQVYFFAGKGNGTFAGSGASVDLGVIGALEGVAGDFNGDGKLDLVISYNNVYSSPTTGGLVFVPGNGDGTFGKPVQFAPISSGVGKLLVGDLNKDGKLDLIWQAVPAVFLGNGDGTFNESPFNLSLHSTDTLLALADLNGDGFPDLVIDQSTTVGATVQDTPNLYAGNGDGTFQSSPFYALSLPLNYPIPSAAVADINGDGYPDLVLRFTSSTLPGSQLSVSYADGKGGFVLDPNVYFAGTADSAATAGTQVFLTRLNNKAPVGGSDSTPDALIFGGGSLTALINAKNPVPAVSPMPSAISLQASTNTSIVNTTITLTATVLGLSPTGSVTFSANGTSLGASAVSNGIAVLAASFHSAGQYSVIATYSGDANNASSASAAVSISVASPDFAVTITPSSLTISAGQTAKFTLSVTPSGGYSGTIGVSCGSLPAEVSCSMAPSSITVSNGTAASAVLSITTTAAVAQLSKPLPSRPAPWNSSAEFALAGLLGLIVGPKLKWRNGGWMCMLLSCVLAAITLLAISGCGSSSKTTSSGPSDPGTPKGTYSVNLTLSDSTGGRSHPVNLSLTVQ